MSSPKNPNAPCLTCKHAPHVAHIDDDQCHSAVSGHASYGYLYAAFWRE